MLRQIATCCVVLTVALAATPARGYNAQDLLIDLKEGTSEKQLAAAMRLADYAQFPEVVTALAAKLDDAKADPVLRATCAASLGRSGDASVYPMLQTLAKKVEEKPLVRAGCVAAMGAIKKGDAIAELVEMLKTEPAAIVRAQIEDSLARMPDPQPVLVAVSPLLKDPASVTSAIRILGFVGGPAVIPPLAKQLEEGKASNRRTVIRALGNIRHADAARALVAFYPKGNEAEKVDVLEALSQHPHPDAVALLIAQMEDAKAFAAVRRRSALSLGILRAPTAVMPLRTILLNTAESDGLRLTCVQALGNYSDRDDAAVAGLIGALADRKMAEESALALSRITRRYFGTNKEKWTEWFQQWRQDRDRNQPMGH
jgi:HEAT repeat protein